MEDSKSTGLTTSESTGSEHTKGPKRKIDDYIREVLSDFACEDSERKYLAYIPIFMRLKGYRRLSTIQSYEGRRYYICFVFNPHLLYTVVADKNIDFSHHIPQLEQSLNDFMAKSKRKIRGFILENLNALALSSLVFININADPASYRQLIRQNIDYMIRKYSHFSFVISESSKIKESSAKIDQDFPIFDTIALNCDRRIDENKAVIYWKSAEIPMEYLLTVEKVKDKKCKITFNTEASDNEHHNLIANYIGAVNRKLEIGEFSLQREIVYQHEFLLERDFTVSRFELLKCKVFKSLDSFFIGMNYLLKGDIESAMIEFEISQDSDFEMISESTNTTEFIARFSSKAELNKEKECISMLQDLSPIFSLDCLEIEANHCRITYKFPSYKMEEVFTDQYDKVHEILTIMQHKKIRIKNFLQKIRFFHDQVYYVYDGPLQDVLENCDVNPEEEIKHYLEELWGKEPGFSDLDMLPSTVLQTDQEWGLLLKKRKVSSSFAKKLHLFNNATHRYKVPILGVAKRHEEYYVVTQKMHSNLKKIVKEQCYSKETINKWFRETTQFLNAMRDRNVFIEEFHLSQVKIDQDSSAMIDLCSVSENYFDWKAPEEVKGVIGHNRVNYRLGNVLYCLVERKQELFDPEDEFVDRFVHEHLRPLISNNIEFEHSQIVSVMRHLWVENPLKRPSFAILLKNKYS